MARTKTRTHRILLTGSSGTLGHHVLDQLLARTDFEVLTIGRSERPAEGAKGNARHQVIDFENKRQLTSVFRRFQPTCVIHCAAGGMIFPHVQWFKLIRFNVEVTLALFEQAAAVPGCHFIHVSTGLAYRATGAPLTENDALENIHPYGASKAAADILLRSAALEFGAPLTLFRPFSFTGLKDNRTRLFPSILRAAAAGEALPLSPGDQQRDFCSARDIARGIVRGVDRPPAPRCAALYNLGSGRALTLRELIDEVVDQLRLPVQLKFGAHGYGAFEPMHLVADITRARSELGWSPEHNLAHAVWQLARESFPALKLREPKEHFSPES